MTKAEFIKAIANYPDDAEIDITKTIEDRDGDYTFTYEADMGYYDEETNRIILF